jgi:hypothetical protein
LQDFRLGWTSQRILHSCFLQDARFLRIRAKKMSLAQPNWINANAPSLPVQGTKPDLAYRVGGITFGLIAEGSIRLALESGLCDFEVETADCDIRIQVGWAEKIEKPSGKPTFDSGGLWSVHKVPDGHQFYFSTPFLGLSPYKAAWFDEEFTTGRVELFQEYFHADGPVYPMEYPLDELLMIHRLSRGEGIEVHAVGIVDEGGSGHLFLGHSGAGKSTTARLWESRKGIHILSDDRIILRERNGEIWMYGTPWHGDAGIASPRAARLTEIYLLEHGGSNELMPLARGQAAAELLARSFVPYHSAKGLNFALGFADQVASKTPCSVFRFVPDESAVEAICRA